MLNKFNIMNRFEIFPIIKKIILDNPIKYKDIDFLDANMAALNVFCTSLFDNEIIINKTFSELNLIEKVKILPIKFYKKLVQPMLNKIIIYNYSLSNNLQISSDVITFFPTVMNHLDQMIPVSDSFKKNNIKYIYITNDIEILKKLLSLNQVGKAFLLNFNKSFYNDKVLENKINDLKNNFGLYFDPKMTENILGFLKTKIPYFIDLIIKLDIMLDFLKIKGVIIGNDLTFDGRIFTQKLKLLKIPTFSIMHGSVSGEPIDSQHIVDTFFVYGLASFEELIKIGNSPKNLMIGGAPYLDQYKIIDNNKIDSRITKKLNIDKNRLYILVVISGPGHCTTYGHFNRIVDSIFQLAYTEKEIQFVFKLHPKDSINNYKIFKQKWNVQNVQIINHNTSGYPKNIFDWLSGVDAIITGASTVALEAMLLDKHVITIDYEDEYKEVEFITERCTIQIINENNLFETIREFKNEKSKYNDTLINSKLYIKNYFANIGSSSEIINKLIIKKCAEYQV